MKVDLKNVVIAVDGDGSLWKHKHPEMGEDIGAQPVLKELIKDGAKIILWTMRHGPQLDEAIEWFKKNNIELFGINHNPEQSQPGPKAYAKLYIDDLALGAPLINNGIERPYIDWVKVRELIYDGQWTSHLKKENLANEKESL